MEPLKETHNVLFIYIQEGNGDFWVYDGASYHRFAWKDGCIRYIRQQAALPAYCSGGCIQVSGCERQILEQEAARHALSLAFCKSETACIERMLHMQSVQGMQREHPGQHIFGRTAPAGYFYQGEWNKHHRSRDGDEV
jgi:hypothetical protein